MKQIKNKKECKEKKKNIGVCYGGNCSNEQFSNCYPMSKEERAEEFELRKEIKKWKNL